MAKKGPRIKFAFSCQKCGRMNYVGSRNKLNVTSPLKLKKYCRFCRQHTLHEEKKKL